MKRTVDMIAIYEKSFVKNQKSLFACWLKYANGLF